MMNTDNKLAGRIVDQLAAYVEDVNRKFHEYPPASTKVTMAENIIPPLVELTISSTPICSRRHKLSDKWECELGRTSQLFASRTIWKHWRCVYNAHNAKTHRRRKYWYNQAVKWSNKV